MGLGSRGSDGWLHGVVGRLRRVAHRVRDTANAEGDRWILWIPVFLGVGVASYFGLPTEPPLWLGAAAAVVGAGLAVAARQRPAVLAFVLAPTVAAAGFTAAQWRTAAVAAPALSRAVGPATVTGRLIGIEVRPHGHRVTLDSLRISFIPPQRTPERVRIGLRGSQPDLVPGDWIRLRARLLPPPAPAAPGAFDFQRLSYFREIGAVGFALGAAEVVARSEGTGLAALSLGLASLRQRVTRKVLDSQPGERGAVAAALMTGERGAIPKALTEAMRKSGLAHLLAISGLHIGLVAGTLFFGLRAVLALVPPIALRVPIKKWAAAAAIPGAFAYALIAGATIPTQRAFLMVGLVLLAVLLDRRGLSMRLVAWAAAVLLLIQPDSLLGPSFQLSFAAVTALIATYEVVRDRRRVLGYQGRDWRRVALLYIGGVLLTTVVAGAATAPFALFHFNRVAGYGVAANLIAVPATALWVMPWAVVAFALMPLGLEDLALTPMTWGLGVVIEVAKTVSGWPGSVTLLPAMPTWGLAVLSVGGLWLCLWRRGWRFLGLGGVAAGLVSMAIIDPPDLLVDGRGKLLAVRSADGTLSVSSMRAQRFIRDVWLRRAGQPAAGPPWPSDNPGAGRRLSCDGLGCVYRARGKVVALVRHPAALLEDCWIADAVISTVPVRRDCSRPAIVIDRFDLWREGSHALWLEADRIRVESVNRTRGHRPWVIRPSSR